MLAEASTVNIVEKTDSEIRLVADPLWRDLLRHSNAGQYGEFVAKFSRSFALGPINIP